MRVERPHDTSALLWGETENRIITEVFAQMAGKVTMCEIDRAVAEELGRAPDTVMKQRLKLGLKVAK